MIAQAWGISWQDKGTFGQKSLLELGCSAGFFLDEAKKQGFSTKGFELSGKEVAYATKLGLDVVQKSFLEIPVSKYEATWDAIAAFFVIEHISEIGALWERISHWLKPGGVLVLALPSLHGPTFCTQPNTWFETHPSDHFYDYDPSSLKKLLSRLGMRLSYSRPLSYHPQRDRGLLGKLPKKVYQIYADLACYGDTFQVAATKTKP